MQNDNAVRAFFENQRVLGARDASLARARHHTLAIHGRVAADARTCQVNTVLDRYRAGQAFFGDISQAVKPGRRPVPLKRHWPNQAAWDAAFRVSMASRRAIASS